MPTKTRVNINPKLLIWARENTGYSIAEAAKKVGIKPEKLISFELGKALPTTNQLRNLGKVYRRPAAIFYLDNPPESTPEIKDYRKLPGVEETDSPELFYEIRRAFERREITLDLLDELNEDLTILNLHANLSEPPYNVAKRIRNELGVTYSIQTNWNNQYKALNHWIQAIESKGILVFQTSAVNLSLMRGFNISDRPIPVIVINAKDYPRGRIFTLLHEFTHVMLSTSGICDLYDHDKIEVFCNLVAGEALVPETFLLQEEIVKSHHSKTGWSNQQLQYLANRYMVSQEVILRKLLIAGRTTESYYNYKRNEYLNILDKANGRKDTGKKGFAERYKIILRDNGFSYTSLVINAYHNELISSRDMSNFLGGIKLNHVSKIEQSLLV